MTEELKQALVSAPSLTYLELGGGIEFRLNGVQLHPEMFLIHLDCITAFSLNLLFDQYLPEKHGWGGEISMIRNTGTENITEGTIAPGNSFKVLKKCTDGIHESFQFFKNAGNLPSFCWTSYKGETQTCSTLWERSISFLLYWAILATVVAWFFWSSLMSLEIICKAILAWHWVKTVNIWSISPSFFFFTHQTGKKIPVLLIARWKCFLFAYKAN